MSIPLHSIPPKFLGLQFPGMKAAATASLVALVLQNTSLVILMKHSYRPTALTYSTAAVVALAEGLKVITCFCISSYTEGLHPTLYALRNTPTQLSLALPCILYVIQNNLLFVAIQNLPATLYVVCSQGKIISSALFSVFLLKTKMTQNRVIALFLLVCGMIFVQLPSRAAKAQAQGHMNLEKGLAAVFVACFTSGFAGVYLEGMYKSSSDQSSVMTKNMQLSAFSFPISLLMAFIHNFDGYYSVGFFHGFDGIVVLVLILQALGGVIIGVVMRHASTLLKCFAVSISICLCAIISVSQGQEVLSLHLIAGILLVNSATFIYSSS